MLAATRKAFEVRVFYCKRLDCQKEKRGVAFWEKISIARKEEERERAGSKNE
jgi:hypothetical protein